jgi:hypothetical protein
MRHYPPAIPRNAPRRRSSARFFCSWDWGIWNLPSRFPGFDEGDHLLQKIRAIGILKTFWSDGYDDNQGLLKSIPSATGLNFGGSCQTEAMSEDSPYLIHAFAFILSQSATPMRETSPWGREVTHV